MLKSFFIAIVSIFVLVFCSQKESDEKLLGSDIRLFRNVAWSLAKAVDVEDTIRIKKILKRGKIDVDIREPKFGKTLLLWAVTQKKYYSAKALLEMGADPNLQDYSNSKSAIIEAAFNDETSKFLKLVLKFGGDPNNYADTTINNYLHSPLIAASKVSIENVKLLIDAGAEVNYTVGGNVNALRAATISQKPYIVWYLLSKCKADFTKPMIKTVFTNENLYITNLLRNWLFDLDSEEYKMKMRIVEYLRQNSMDYRVTEIPERFRNKFSKEYLEKY